MCVLPATRDPIRYPAMFSSAATTARQVTRDHLPPERDEGSIRSADPLLLVQRGVLDEYQYETTWRGVPWQYLRGRGEATKAKVLRVLDNLFS